MRLIDIWRSWRSQEIPAKPAQAELPLAFAELHRVKPVTFAGKPATFAGKPATFAGKPAVVEVYRSGRWHLRDGNRFGKSPYYGDPQTGHIRLIDEC